MSENWLAIPDYEGFYEASSLGRIRSLPRTGTRKNGALLTVKGQVLTPYYSKKNYLVVMLSVAGVSKQMSVHRLVCRTFHGKPAPNHEVRHMNGIDTDNRAINLKWGTRAQNIQDIIRHGRHHLANAVQCKHGHPFDESNTIYRKVGTKTYRQCRACKRASHAGQRWRVNATVNLAEGSQDDETQ